MQSERTSYVNLGITNPRERYMIYMNIKCEHLVIYNVHFFLLSLEISDWWVYILKCDVTIVDEELIIHTCPWRLWDRIMNSNGILSHQTYCNIEICLVWRAFSQNRLHSYPLSNVGQWYLLFLFQWIRSIFPWLELPTCHMNYNALGTPPRQSFMNWDHTIS